MKVLSISSRLFSEMSRVMRTKWSLLLLRRMVSRPTSRRPDLKTSGNKRSTGGGGVSLFMRHCPALFVVVSALCADFEPQARPCKYDITVHYAALTLSLWPLIWVRFSLEMMALACSEGTSTKRCRPRMSTVPTTLPGRPVSPAIVLTISMGTTPFSSPTFIHRRVLKGWVTRLVFGLKAGRGSMGCDICAATVDCGLGTGITGLDAGFGTSTSTAGLDAARGAGGL